MIDRLEKTLNQKAFIYAIKYNEIPIYIGSTLNIERREKDHNINLKKVINKNGGNKFLYDYIYRFNNELNINYIKLHIIKEIYNDIVIIKNNLFEYRRNIEEEKIIRYCLNKGICLTNMVYPCVYWFDDNKLIHREKLVDSKIKIQDYNITKNINIYNYILEKEFEESLNN